MRLVASTLALAALPLIQLPGPTWTPLASGVTARLRGVSAVSDRVAWASGAQGTVLRTIDGGASWQRRQIPGSDQLDFRDIDAIDDRVAYVLSIGPGEASKIFKTADGGETWTEQFVNRDPEAFFDAMSFWDAQRGVAVSDSVDGRFVILTTADGGRTWTRVPDAGLPPALANEGCFAASGTNVATLAPGHAWIGTGAAAQARVLRSSDGGRTWTVAATPLAAGPSAGIFSIAFSDPTHGIVVGGDYKAEAAAVDNVALTSDGGATWTAAKGLTGFRSVAAFLGAGGRTILAIGPGGADLSRDGGATWGAWGQDAVTGAHTFSIARGSAVGFAAGERGGLWSLRWRQ